MSDHLFVSSSFQKQLDGVSLVGPTLPKIVSWADGTDEQIAAMLDAHYDGIINLHEIWNVGDTRKVHLSAMEAVGVDESHVEQDVELQLVNKGGKTLANNSECAFVVQLKDCLCNPDQYTGGYQSPQEDGYMHPDKTCSGWADCARREWCNSIFKNAFPQNIRNLFKLHINSIKTVYDDPDTHELIETISEYTRDYFALPSIYNVYDSNATAYMSPQIVYCNESQWEYYAKNNNNRIKYIPWLYSSTNDPINVRWWLRDQTMTYGDLRFYFAPTDTTVVSNSHTVPNDTRWLAPYGCI